MSPPIGVAVLGAGIFATEAHLPALKILANAYALRAVYSRSKTSASTFALTAESTLGLAPSSVHVFHDEGDTTTNLDALLKRSDINAVIVVLPITLQPSIVLKALEAGKHVICEKPIAKDVAAGAELIKTYLDKYKPKGLVFRIAENFECEPGLRKAGEALRSGKIGKVLFWTMTAVNRTDEESKWYKTPWRTVAEYQGGFLLDGGVHSAALVRVLIPSPLTKLTGWSSLNKKHLAPHDTIHAVIQSADGSHGIFELSFAGPSNSRSKSSTIVTGSDGWLEITQIQVPDTNGILRGHYKVIIRSGTEGIEEIVALEPVSGVEKELESFAAAVNGKDDGLGDPRGALRDVAIIQAGLESNGNVVDLTKLVPEL